MSVKAACSKCGDAVEGGHDSDLSGKKSNSINGVKPQISKDETKDQTFAGEPGQGNSIAEKAAATLTIN